MNTKDETKEIEKPLGDFIFEHAGIGAQLNDGMYYHYAKVCNLLKKYVHEKERRHVQLATDYKNQEEQNDSFRKKIQSLEQLLKAADEVIRLNQIQGEGPNYVKAIESYTALKQQMK